MRLAIVVEAIPPYCGGGEQVAWIHAVEMAKKHDVAVVTFGDAYSQSNRDGVDVYYLPRRAFNFAAYSTIDRPLLNRCLDHIAPTVIHCHMPHLLSACLRKKKRLMVSTIHGGVSEKELLKLNYLSRRQLLKFRLIRHINFSKSDAITCVSQHSCYVLRSLYPTFSRKFSFIPNPIYERFLDPVIKQPGSYVLNFGRQIRQKMAALLDTARLMPETCFVFVGTGEMVRDYGLSNVKFVGFSDAVEKYIDESRVCVFPSQLENFPLVGLEAMARGKPVIASKSGFSEYIQHMKNGFLLDSTEPATVAAAIRLFLHSAELSSAIGFEARKTAEKYHPANVIELYTQLYQSARASAGAASHSMIGK